MPFRNTSKPAEPYFKSPGAYRYDTPSEYLLLWRSLLQNVISQAGTYLLTGKFHTQRCGIYKCEGGCNIVGVGDLVLCKDQCYFDYYPHAHEDKTRKMADLITHIVLGWDPEEPVESMLILAAERAGCPVEELRAAVADRGCNLPFGGDALSQFFDTNPFSPLKHDPEYRRYCLGKFNAMSPEQIDEVFADEALGEDYLKKIQDKVRSVQEQRYRTPMCCSPKRTDGVLQFWINTGLLTQIDGWKTREDLDAFLAGDGILTEKKWVK